MSGLDEAWAAAEAALPEGYYISNVRSRTTGGRWSASATLAHDISGASVSGFGATPADALLALAGRLRKDEHHHVYRWDDVVAEKKGGPPPRCRLCDQEAIR